MQLARWALLPLWGLPCGLMPGGGWCRSRTAGGALLLWRGPPPIAGDDRRRVQSVLWGGAPAPVGLMPRPRRGGCHYVAMGARCLDRCRGRVVLLPMSARPIAGRWACTSGALCVGLAGRQWSVRSHRTAAAWAKSSKERTQSGKSFGPALSAYLATLVLPVG